MSFRITKEKAEDLEAMQITDCASGIQVRILPGHGAMLHEYSIPSGNRRIQVINSYKNSSDLRQNFSSSYKSAKLSPFVCRLAGGTYTYEEKSYEFLNKFPDGSAIHGILYNKPFEVSETVTLTDSASILLSYLYQKDDPAFPFSYLITVKYTLKTGGRLELETSVKNLSERRIPMADGWHPYFNLEGKVNDWLFSFRSKKMLIFNEKLIPLGGLVDYPDFYEPTRIGDTFLDNCFLLEPTVDKPAAVLENPANGLRLSFYPDSHYPYLQIYTPGDRESIAIENLSAAPDAFNNELGLIHLEPDGSQSFSVVYQLEFR